MSEVDSIAPDVRSALTRVARDLHERFPGVFGQETIEAVVTRMFRVEPTQGEIDTLCDELFHQDGD